MLTKLFAIGGSGDGASFKSDLKGFIPFLIIIIIIAFVNSRRNKKK